jgi:hypothetical protein
VQAAHDVAHGGARLRVAGGGAAHALDEHLLPGLLGKTGGGDRLVGDSGLAVAGVLAIELLLADRTACDRRDDDERQPAEDRRLAMLRAPAAGAGGEVVSHGGLLRGRLHHCVPACRRGSPPSMWRPGVFAVGLTTPLGAARPAARPGGADLGVTPPRVRLPAG